MTDEINPRQAGEYLTALLDSQLRDGGHTDLDKALLGVHFVFSPADAQKATNPYKLHPVRGPIPPRNVDLAACPLWQCTERRTDDPPVIAQCWTCPTCAAPRGHCEPDCADPTEPHGERALRAEIARLRAVLGWVDVNDRWETERKRRAMSKQYGRASRTIAELRGVIARLRENGAAP